MTAAMESDMTASLAASIGGLGVFAKGASTLDLN